MREKIGRGRYMISAEQRDRLDACVPPAPSPSYLRRHWGDLLFYLAMGLIWVGGLTIATVSMVHESTHYRAPATCWNCRYKFRVAIPNGTPLKGYSYNTTCPCCGVENAGTFGEGWRR